MNVNDNVWLFIIARHSALSRFNEKHGVLNLSNFASRGNHTKICDCWDVVVRLTLDKNCNYKRITSEDVNKLGKEMGLIE